MLSFARPVVLVLAIAAGLVAGLASPAAAFDGERRGFVLGFGAGPGDVILTGDSDLGSVFGVATDFKIGIGVNNRTIIHYSGKQLWHIENSLVFSEAFPLVAITRYKLPEGPCPFYSVGAGVGAFADVFGESGNTGIGPAVFVGGGYEFKPHWSVEFDVAHTFGWGNSVGTWGLLGTINVLAY